MLHFCGSFQRFLSAPGCTVVLMDGRWTPRRQGDAGELSAMYWLAMQGAVVSLPVGHSPDYDLIADFGDELARVQVKTATHYRNSRWEAMLCTMGGNQSWQGVVKRFHQSRCDRLFIHVGDGRRWYIPSEAVAAGRALLLGGPKYAEYEVEPGEPLLARPAVRNPLLKLDSTSPAG
jgi:hypothetical protein